MRTLRKRKGSALGLMLAGCLLTGCPSGKVPLIEPDERPTATEEGSHDGHEKHMDLDDEHGEEGLVELSLHAIQRVGLTTARVSSRPISGRLTTTGKVGFDERNLAHLSSRVAGRLVRVDAELGESLQEGEALAVVDSMELGQARAAFLRRKAHHEVAQRHFERERSLHSEQIVSEQEVLEAEGQAREAAADLAAARGTLLLLGFSADEIARLSWENTGPSQVSVRAPFAGRVVSKDATRGELVTPEDTLFTLADLSQVWVWIDIYEKDLRHVRPAEAAEVRFDAWPGESFTGTLAYIADEVDPASRTVRARVDLTNSERRLKPGMFARVLLAGDGAGASSSTVAVPREAVQRHGEASVVFVRKTETRFERRPIAAGQVTEDWVEILAGLEPGEEVVTVGAFLLKSQISAGQLGGHHH